ncbi:hypothetical protein JCGZ_11724 [Jatropha curcas]|uniref:Uncharacterized protein n=1 Tax=Jatropha curcas TaxID=180498 RepID=A0A067K8L3_JATCU|nr:uncharacterized protein LOC105640628 [Jatropha curcas]KDP31348.1 hypothetical protein JCGZ_11724 [Jatropha curcas]
MDLWVVGAAAAAGYIAKYWQNISRDRDNLSESGPSKCKKHEIPSCPFPPTSRRKKLTEDTSTVERLSDMYQSDGASQAEVSTSGYVEKLGNLGNYEQNVFSRSSLPPGFSTFGDLKENKGGKVFSGNMVNNTGEMESFHDSTKKISSLRTKHSYGHFIKPLSSLDSCLMAQLYKKHVQMEEYVFSVIPSPSTTTRPLLVTDGNQTINRANDDYFSARIGAEDNRLFEENVCGVPPLPKISEVNIPSKIKSRTQKRNNERLNNYCKTGSGRHFHSQNGSLDQMVLFCLGVCVGIVSSLLASRREADKLRDLLKQSENLVQDLQEELEMKDSLTVKEIAEEKCESQDTCENLFHYRAPSLLLPSMDDSTKNLSCCGKAEESPEDMSKIEAELEAELERLGLNMNTSSLERRLSDLVEVDPDFVAGFAEGELRTDMVHGQSVTGPQSDRDASGTLTTHSGNYVVSPRELSLRLHEVIQYRLEERVKKLEMALQNSERKVKLLESDLKNDRQKTLGSMLKYYSGEESPITEEDFNSMAQPLVMNLSGEALDAYNEAYEELMKIDESEEDDSPRGIYENNHQGCIHTCSESILWSKKDTRNGSSIHHSHNKEKPSRELYLNQLKASIGHVSRIQELHSDGASEDENGDCNDEMEKQLIKQIVEKTRKGSPAVINAQRVFFLSTDESEQ